MNSFFMVKDMILPGNHYWNVVIGGVSNDISNDVKGIDKMKRLGESMA